MNFGADPFLKGLRRSLKYFEPQVRINIPVIYRTMHLPDDERNLVELAISGNADAFGELYLHYIDSIFRYFYFRVGDVEEAEDLSEQVFLKAWEALAYYKNLGFPFSSWLFRIAHNLVVDFHRKSKTIPHSLENLADEIENFDKQANTLSMVIEKDDKRELSKAISRLPEDQQQVIVLRFIEGLSHKEIARIMEKNEGACRMIQHRALSTLNRLIEGE